MNWAAPFCGPTVTNAWQSRDKRAKRRRYGRAHPPCCFKHPRALGPLVSRREPQRVLRLVVVGHRREVVAARLGQFVLRLQIL